MEMECEILLASLASVYKLSTKITLFPTFIIKDWLVIHGLWILFDQAN